MFSTLLGPLPTDKDADRDFIADVRALAATGLELISDGGPPIAGDALGSAAARWRAAQAVSDVPVKAVLLGPYSASRSAASAIADPIRATVLELAAAGCLLVEIAEPNASPIADDPAEAAIFHDAHRRLIDGTEGIHASVALTGASFDGVAPDILFDLAYASFAFDLIAGPDNWRLIAKAPSDRGIICGAMGMSPRADRTREVLVWAAHYAASTSGRGLERIGLANAPAGPATSRAEALERLTTVAEASRIAATDDPERLGTLLDPRAVDIRSAAMGRYDPARPRRRPR